ncbi:MAG TPA: hypothetical protein VK536_00345 [Candidatus Limnocylindrales bacterium]|nr:hypothetical protein [Candidatus Limnocylindrales bacterium]
MPFCRKCGRRLSRYSENCPECGTSTTAAMIKIKAPHAQRYEATPKTKIAKLVIPRDETSVSVKPVIPTKSIKTPISAKVESNCKPIYQPKPAIAAEELKHEIKQSNLSLEEDIIANPHDYETQTFDFNLQCPYKHFFTAGSTLPVSKGKAYCPICGEQLRKPKHNKKRRYSGL